MKIQRAAFNKVVTQTFLSFRCFSVKVYAAVNESKTSLYISIIYATFTWFRGSLNIVQFTDYVVRSYYVRHRDNTVEMTTVI